MESLMRQTIFKQSAESTWQKQIQWYLKSSGQGISLGWLSRRHSLVANAAYKMKMLADATRALVFACFSYILTYFTYHPVWCAWIRCNAVPG